MSLFGPTYYHHCNPDPEVARQLRRIADAQEARNKMMRDEIEERQYADRPEELKQIRFLRAEADREYQEAYADEMTKLLNEQTEMMRRAMGE